MRLAPQFTRVPYSPVWSLGFPAHCPGWHKLPAPQAAPRCPRGRPGGGVRGVERGGCFGDCAARVRASSLAVV